ncbi:MAG: SPASM domain-containing protein [Flavobacteriales bacterium]|nr:SPASM domain-containing protein [Flavobacteriales bacterium]
MTKLNDQLNILSKITFSRILNDALVIGSYYSSKLSGRAQHWGFPISVSIEPTTSCNLRCPECPSGLRSFSRDTGMLNKDFFKTVVEQLYKKSTYLTFYFQGEPFLNKDFLKMVNIAADKNMYTSTSSNAHYFDDQTSEETIKSGLDRLIISIDGTTQETYESYRVGGKIDKVWEGTKNIIKWKKKLKSKTPYVIFQYLVVRPNEHQLDEIQEIADNLGVDEVRFKTAQIYDFKNGNELIPTIDKYSRYKKNRDGTYSIKNKLNNHCWRLWNSSVITWDGNVVPCCFDKDATHKMGSLQNNTFSQIWQSEPYYNFRNLVLKSRSEVEICKNCTEGTTVWA